MVLCGLMKSAVTLLVVLSACRADDEVLALRLQVKALASQLEASDVRHSVIIDDMKIQIKKMREERQAGSLHTAVEELRAEMHHLSTIVNSSILLKQQHVMENEVHEAISQASGLSKQVEQDRRRLERNSIVLGQVQTEAQLLRTAGHDMRTDVIRLRKELTMAKYKLNSTIEALNELRRPPTMKSPVPCRPRKFRHLRVIRKRLADLAKEHREVTAIQENFQMQLAETQNRVSLCAKLTDANLDSSRVDILELENRIQMEQIQNLTREVSDFDKLHVSMLELLENVENVETKVDKTLPEYRKEISKLDVNMAQVNSQISYTREDQENLRQSVKAIAFSVSNAIDKTDLDRRLLHHVNKSVSALEQLSKQHSYRLYDHILKSEANRTGNDTTYDPFVELPELMGEVKDLQPAHNEYEQLVSRLPRDCSDVAGPPGIYLIAPSPKPVEVWCNNGSTLLQRRFNGSVEFNVKFAEYVQPIGRPDTEFWLGLENMHRLTVGNCSSMRIDMIDIYGGRWYASYDEFSVGPADSGYKLFVGGFKGNASDAFEYQNRMEFSAIDRDRDISNTHCAGNYEGGWWFSHCQHVNINGKYSLGLTWFDSVRNEWIAVASSEMTVSRNVNCA